MQHMVLGYIVGATYHDAYWHKDFTVVGGSRTEVRVRDVATGVERTHSTHRDRFTVPVGECQRCQPVYVAEYVNGDGDLVPVGGPVQAQAQSRRNCGQ